MLIKDLKQPNVYVSGSSVAEPCCFLAPQQGPLLSPCVLTRNWSDVDLNKLCA